MEARELSCCAGCGLLPTGAAEGNMRSCPALEMCHSFLCCELGMPATAPLHLHTPFPHTTPPPLPPITRRCAWASLPAGSVLPFAERPAALQCLLQLHGLHSPVVTARAAKLDFFPLRLLHGTEQG